MSKDHTERLAKNAESKAHAINDTLPWTAEELEWLQSWDGTEAYLEELAELLGRTIEACRQKYHTSRRIGFRVTSTRTTTTTTRTTEYRGWTEADGDGW